VTGGFVVAGGVVVVAGGGGGGGGVCDIICKGIIIQLPVFVIAFITTRLNAAIAAVAGIVIIHAYIIRLPTPHLTAENLLVAPTPMIAPEIA